MTKLQVSSQTSHTGNRHLSTLAIMALAVSLASAIGCGGGGGGGGSSTGPKPATLTGIVDFTAGTPATGYSVHFSTFAATTDTHGAFAIDFDAAVINGSQTLTIFDAGGALIDKETINVSSGGGTLSVGTIAVGPPAPPP